MQSAHDLESLAAFAEGRLDERERQSVIAHVGDCAECREALAELGRAFADGSLAKAQAHRPARSLLSHPALRIGVALAASFALGTFAWLRFGQDAQQTGAPVTETAPAQPTEEDLLRTRSGARMVAGKTFRLIDGQWIDEAVEASPEAPEVLVQGGEAQRQLLREHPELRPFTELGDRVVVAWQGTLYRFEP